MERKLNEQWVEELDGKKHMLKAVECGEHWCDGCCFNTGEGNCSWDSPKYCRNGSEYRIKDLGILNEDGLLPCPFCGEYPGKRVGNDTWKCGCEIGAIATWQEAIDAWNRRA